MLMHQPPRMKNPFIQIQRPRPRPKPGPVGRNNERQSVKEIKCILHEDVLQYNISLSGCFQLMHNVYAHDYHILYAHDVANERQ
jgi:hypothetical protein